LGGLVALVASLVIVAFLPLCHLSLIKSNSNTKLPKLATKATKPPNLFGIALSIA
jgi:hypothetical protein